MPKIVIGQKGKRVDLQPKDVLGGGGEGTVFRAVIPGGAPVAVKIYHDFLPQRVEKVMALKQLTSSFPKEVVGPTELVWDTSGKRIVGYAMRLLPPGQQPFETLMVRKHREAHGITTRDVVDIYLKLHRALEALHAMEVVVGDLNPLNELYRRTDIALIDVDSFQFGRYPCPVATERCLNPRLYGVDLSIKPVFKSQDDWYSFLVLLFSSLLLVHPYGGAHRQLRTIPRRAIARVTVLDSSVIFPKVAYPPEVVTDDFLHLFMEVFAKGKQVVPDAHLLEEYRSILVGCPTCGLWYPHLRQNCPGCDALNQQAQSLKVRVRGLDVTELLVTQGSLVFFKLIGRTIYAIAIEQDEAVLYAKKQLEKPRRVPLFKATRGTRYDIFDKYLVVCRAPYDIDQPPLYIFDISGDRPLPVTKTVTERFANRGGVFRGTVKHLYRLVGGILLRGKIPFGKDLVEDVAATVMEKQTWFDAASRSDKELLFGYYRVFDKYQWYLINNGVQHLVAIPELNKGEAMVDRSIRFSLSSVLLLRRTRKGMEEYCRIDVVDIQSARVTSSRKVSLTNSPHFADIHKVAYARGTILIPVPDGLLAENAKTGLQKSFPDTANYVGGGSQIWPYDNGILVVLGNRVIKLVIRR